jgi:hypothetical protein
VAVYHTRKAEATDFVEMVQGTFGLAAGADTILLARRGRGEARRDPVRDRNAAGTEGQEGLGEKDLRRPCPECGADSAEPGYRGHANGCLRFYAKEES